MATTTAKIVVDTNQAVNALNQLQNKIKTTNEGFSALKGALAGLAIGSFIKSAFDLADAMSDLADATEMSIGAVMGFSKAVAASGGSAEGAGKSLLKFTENIGSAAEGSAALQESFAKVGISLSDLGKLSSEDLLKKTIEGIAKIGDVAARSKVQTDLLGKGFKGVNAPNVANTMGPATEASRAAADSMKKAAESMDKLNATLTTLKEKVLIALEPFVDKINSMDTARIEKLLTIVVQLGLAFGAFKVATMAFGALTGGLAAAHASLDKVGKSFDAIKNAATVGGAGVDSLAKTWSRFGYQARAVWSDFGSGKLTLDKISNTTIPVLATRMKHLGAGSLAVAKGFAGMAAAGVMALGSLLSAIVSVGAAVIVMNETVAAITGFDFVDTWAKKLEGFVKNNFPAVHKAVDDLGKKMGMADINGKPQDGGSEKKGNDEVDAFAKKAMDSAKAKAAAYREVTDALAKQRVEIAKIVQEYQLNNEEANKRFAVETSLIGLSEQQRASMIMKNEKEVEYLNTKKKLQDQINAISAGTSDREKAELIPVLTAEMAKLTAEYEKQKAAVDQLVAARSQEEAANQLRLFGIQQEIGLTNNLNKIQDDMAKMTMTSIEQKYYDISAAARDNAKAAIEAEEARRGEKLNPDEIKKYYAEASKGAEQVAAATKKSYDHARTFETGWKKALNSYVENATDSAQKAERLFTKAFGGMEDAIVGFAKTGKFEWKSFVSSMLEELLRSQIQSLFGNMMKSMSGSMNSAASSTSGATAGGSEGGGLLASIGSMFGLGGGSGGAGAQGSPVFITNWPTSMGGTGVGAQAGAAGGQGGGQSWLGSAWDTVGGWFGSDSATASQYGTNSGSQQTSMLAEQDSAFDTGWMDTVSESFSGLGDWAGGLMDSFGGWFAEGGSIGPGKFGIVGERGPEFISGPATITPMSQAGAPSSGGVTQVTYNIVANDAASFKQMLAQDPTFIYALTQQGAKGMPA